MGISHVHSTSVSPGPVRVCIFDERKERGRRKRREEGVQRTRSYIRRKWGGGGKEKKKQNKTNKKYKRADGRGLRLGVELLLGRHDNPIK